MSLENPSSPPADVQIAETVTRGGEGIQRLFRFVSRQLFDVLSRVVPHQIDSDDGSVPISELDMSLSSFPPQTTESINGFLRILKKEGYSTATIVVMGRRGTGKSTLVNQMIAEHAVAVQPSGRAISRWRGPLGWLTVALDPVLRSFAKILPISGFALPLGANNRKNPRINILTRKIGDFRLDIIDTPGLPSDGTQGFLPELHKILMQRGGILNVLAYVTRLDDSRCDRGEEMDIRAISSFLGPHVWRQALVVYTHAHSLPPDDLDYLTYVRGRRDLLWQSIADTIPHGESIHKIRRGEGENDLSYAKMNAPHVALVEASPQCPQDEHGQNVLPDGGPWLPELYQVLSQLIEETSREHDDEANDEMTEQVDERLMKWREEEEVLALEMDTWYMERRPSSYDSAKAFRRGGYNVPSRGEKFNGFLPFASFLTLYIAVYCWFDVRDSRIKRSEDKNREMKGSHDLETESFVVTVNGEKVVKRGEASSGTEIQEESIEELSEDDLFNKNLEIYTEPLEGENNTHFHAVEEDPKKNN